MYLDGAIASLLAKCVHFEYTYNTLAQPYTLHLCEHLLTSLQFTRRTYSVHSFVVSLPLIARYS